jgi:hypothetical protein
MPSTLFRLVIFCPVYSCLWNEALGKIIFPQIPVLQLQGKRGEKRLIPDAFLGGRARG